MTDSQDQSAILANILTSLQQGVIAINSITKTFSSIFPSS